MSAFSVVGVLAISLLVTGVLGALYQRSRGAAPWVPRVLRLAALLVTVVIAVAYVSSAWHDSGWFGLVLIGVPVLCCAVAVTADATGRRTAMLTTVAAVGLLLWSVVTILGLGLYFLGPAVLLAAAAATAWQGERWDRGRAATGSTAGTPA